MEHLAEILEHELEQAVEVKNKSSLHRYIVLLNDNIFKKYNYDQNLLEVKNEIKLLAETMRQGFMSNDKRFEAVDKRFEDMNKKFTMMFTFMNLGFGIIILLIILFKFLM